MDMKARINIDLVRFAVSRVITCPRCGKVLDTDTTVLVERDPHTTVLCRPCWDGIRKMAGVKVTVTDGRTGAETVWIGASTVEPEKSEANIEGEQLDLLS